MPHDAFTAHGFRGQFSGHETFPLRYGWLKKVADALSRDPVNTREVFDPDAAMADFGVGKNMVVSMRYWSTAAGIISSQERELTQLGHELLLDSGLDPYFEKPASLWLLHWQIAGSPKPTTTWYWAFNYFNGIAFERDQFVSELVALCRTRGWDRVSAATIRRDVECFIRTYLVGRGKAGDISEDSLECPLSELELIVPAASRGTYQFQRGPKPSLPDEVFCYALWQYWKGRQSAESMTVDAVTYEPGAPGRVFKLDEASVADRLARIEDVAPGVFRWTETAGLQQVQRMTAELEDELELLRPAYSQDAQGAAA